MRMQNKNLRHCKYTVTAQTDYNLGALAAMSGLTKGHIIDKLVREKMLSLRQDKENKTKEGKT